MYLFTVTNLHIGVFLGQHAMKTFLHVPATAERQTVCFSFNKIIYTV